MTCPRCQQDNPPHARFCLGCGARLALTCGSCGMELPGGARFCLQCGQAVTAGTAAPAGSPAPETYTPKHLAEKILTSKAALEGERKQVTVLFADLKGSMELLADRDPEDARKLLDPVLERMMEAVHRYEGTVNQVMGDGIMALFGAPLAHEDHAVRACYAALRMQESVKRYAEVVRREHGVTIRIRVGLNSGEVVVRAIGSDLHMDYTAVGQTTHLGARMEQLAEPGSILLTPATLELVEGYVMVTPLGPVSVKGLPAPLEVYELIGAGAVRSRLHAAAARGLTRFVGRESDVDQLRQALERAQAGHGQVVAVVGEPGVGKSRLYWEFIHSHRAQGWLILESGSVSYGKATAYLPVINLLKAYFHIEGGDETRVIHERVTGKVLSLDRALEPSLSALLSLLEIPVEDEAWGRLDPPQRRQRTLDAVKHLLLRESQVQPLMLLFEDLHWIDAETQELLANLIESLPTARLLLLVNYRPEYQHGWGSKTYYRQLRIDPLPAASADDLLTSLVGTDTSLDALKRTLIDRTEGNPLFLEESVRSLAETRALTGERGAYRLTHHASAIQVPASVQAILAARIDRLSPEHKRLLQAASVIGSDVPFALLVAIAELAEEDLRRGLAHLQAAEFLYETSLFPDLAYTFKHALTHEVTYGGLLQERRRDLHARLVDAIEMLHRDRLDEQTERLAHHAFRGAVWQKSVGYLRQAGTKTAAHSAYRVAVAYFEQALAALAHLPESRDTLGQATDLRIDLRNSLWLLGEFDRMMGYLREAEGLARTLDDPCRLAWVWVYMSHYFWFTGQSAEARTFGQNAHAIAETLGDRLLGAAATTYLGLDCLTSGDYWHAEDFFRNVLESLAAERERERCGLPFFPVPACNALLAWALAERGVFDESVARGQDAARITEALDHPYTRVFVSWGLGSLYGGKGEFSHAVDLLERALALSREMNLGTPSWSSDIPRSTHVSASVTYHWVTTGLLGYTYALSGRVAEGLLLLEQASEAIALTPGTWQSLNRVNLAEAYALAGRHEDAQVVAHQALNVTREWSERGWQARVLRLLGELASQPNAPDVETASSHYRQAMRLAAELGMRPLVAHCHLGLGKLYRRIGEREQARAHLTTATTMYRETDMRFWLEQAELQLRELA
jgi:class 3 adenylate cyclase/tetratricopeptide (TPR) repeat protein